jgi:agmatine deiminase
MSWALPRAWEVSLTKAKRELSAVIRTIAEYEPVKVLAPKGVLLREARHEFEGCSTIEVIEAPIDSIWMRDIAPTFALKHSGKTREVVALD